MWIIKFKLKHDCVIGNRCQKFKVTTVGTPFNTYQEKGATHAPQIQTLHGDERSINEFIRDQENMALIYLENASSDSLLKPRELIQYLITTYSMSLTRIIGSDKVSEASKHNGQMPHFVHNRDGSIQIPSNFISLNLPPGISSTQLRSGEIPFDRQYGKFSRGIGTHYPNSRMI